MRLLSLVLAGVLTAFGAGAAAAQPAPAAVAPPVAAPTTAPAPPPPYPTAMSDEIHQAIEASRAEIAAIARYYGWTGPVPLAESDALDADARQVSINEPELQQLIRPLPEFEVRDALRMVVAHEVWHFVELHLTHADPAALTGEERVLYECRADLMAARYVTSLASGSPTASQLSYSPAWLIANSLWKTDTPDHPPAGERQAAAQLGALSAMRDRIGSTDPALAAQITQLMDIKSGEALDAWRNAACQQITKFRAAAIGSLIVSSDGLKPAGNDTAFTVNYTNIGYSSLKVSVDLVAIYYPSAANTQRWDFPADFVIQPGETYQLGGRLSFALPRGAIAFLNYSPASEDTLISADIVKGGHPPDRRIVVGANLSAEDAQFGAAVMRLANDALNSFSHSRKPGVQVLAGGFTAGSTIEIPSSTNTTVTLFSDGGARVSATLYSGPSLALATAAFDKTRAAMQRIWPQARFQEVANEGPVAMATTVQLTRYATVKLSISHYQSNYLGLLEITPNVLGLIVQ